MGYRVAWLRIPRRREGREGCRYVLYHYETPIVVVEGGELRYLDGFSPTDASYAYEALRELSPGRYAVLERRPREGTPIYVVHDREAGALYLPRLSACAAKAGNDEECLKWYLRPAFRAFGRLPVYVFDAPGRLVPVEEWRWRSEDYVVAPSRYHWTCPKPDATVVIADGVAGREHVFDVVGRYAYRVEEDELGYRRASFMVPWRRLVEEAVVPPVELSYVSVDAWRGYTEAREVEARSCWVKVVDSAMCSLDVGEAARRAWEVLRRWAMEERCLAAAIVNYTSNVLVVYVDLYAYVPPEKAGSFNRLGLHYEAVEAERESWEATLRGLFPALSP